ncbi:unnamed protein product [Parnassius apollo]|uniref:(apollo) hypothetical protein n=1 Tax=Parnassius apollo TaxID=110799 RepID=A0A8S3WBF7_PARAO|nr:unnamed protein product [Parnassius apollo]
MGSSIFLIKATVRQKKTAVANPLAKRGNYGNIPMNNYINIRPPVPDGPAIPGYGGDHGNGGAGGANKLRWRFGCHLRRLDLATFNARTLRTNEKILSERAGRRDRQVALEYYRIIRGPKRGKGHGDSRIQQLVLPPGGRPSVPKSPKVIQVYAPTSEHPDEEVKEMYEDISTAMHSSKIHYTVLMGDFNAKLGTRKNGELKVGKFGIGQRNLRGQQLADFMEKEGLFMMNSFFQKRPQRKGTWSSPDGSTKNEIDFIMTSRRQLFSDVSVIAEGENWQRSPIPWLEAH